MGVETTFLVPMDASQLESALLGMNLFLYRDAGWTDWWSKNLGRERVVLKHHDYAFSERAENRVIAGFDDPLEEIPELKARYEAEVSRVHSMNGVDVKLESLSLVDGKIVYQNGESEMRLYNLQRALEEHTGQPASELFVGQDLSSMRLSIPVSGFGSWATLKKDAALRRYAKNVVRELRANDVPFFAFYSPMVLLAYVVAENNPLEEKYAISGGNIPLTHLTRRAMFTP
jgi:hypothetical protein